jgi:hypothetical protein
MSTNNNSLNVNQTTIPDDGPYITLDQFFNLVGHAYYEDSMWLYVHVPVSSIGVVLNLKPGKKSGTITWTRHEHDTKIKIARVEMPDVN